MYDYHPFSLWGSILDYENCTHDDTCRQFGMPFDIEWEVAYTMPTHDHQ